ncbi:RluA family pseudouridine synthase [Leuconostocaceae bacterium ESL0723]|nr:RluA family pseudouridine synthase [Leuconostocaceae bacterium ESL0723]
MWFVEKKIPANPAQLTIKDYLKSWHVPKHLRGSLRQNQRVALNGRVVPVNHVPVAGDVLQLTMVATNFANRGQGVQPVSGPALSYYYEDEDLVVVAKPAGMKMHAHSPTETDTLLNFVAADLAEHQTTSRGAPAGAYMVHRLDRATSGLVVVAKNPIVVPALNWQLSQKTMQRTYWAWVSGQMPAESGMIDQPIGRHHIDSRRRQVNGPQAQAALTHWRCLKQTRDASLLGLTLSTGRMHQLRVHLASLGHPIIGDDLYGGSPADRLYLDARQIEFQQPWGGPEQRVVYPGPTNFAQPDFLNSN